MGYNGYIYNYRIGFMTVPYLRAQWEFRPKHIWKDPSLAGILLLFGQPSEKYAQVIVDHFSNFGRYF